MCEVMCEVRIINDNRVVCVKKGTYLSDIIREYNYKFETPCNCVGTCGKCVVIATGALSEPSYSEKEFIEKYGPDHRLACLTQVEGSAEIKILFEDHDLQVRETTGITLPAYTSSYFIEEDLLYFNSKAIAPIEKGQVFGVSIDIGTTGISAYLVDLLSGTVLNQRSMLNPQTIHGHDVLSRICFAIDQEMGTEILQNSILDAVRKIVSEFIDEAAYDSLYKVTIAGNTTMLHLICGVNPEPIAKSPYKPVFTDRLELAPEKLEIPMNKKGQIQLLPSASGYIGADILSGVIATGLKNTQKKSIFVDIGTNGEIVLNNKGCLVATSTAAGPALEGMNISCGMRAVSGAIDTFKVTMDHQFELTTIENASALGICGSGLIDIMANLVEHEIVLKTGKFNTKMNPNFLQKFRDKKLYLTDDIYISQKDIRQIQLAKGAISTGIKMLLDECAIEENEIDEILIAGSFGYHLNLESIRSIGLIPKNLNTSVYFVGNSSLEGAKGAMLSALQLTQLDLLQNEIQVLELSTSDRFQEFFIKELGFSNGG